MTITKENIDDELTYTELMKLTENELKKLFLQTRSAIIGGKKIKKDVTNIEIYNCYIALAIEDKNS
jgi:hypothetical protein